MKDGFEYRGDHPRILATSKILIIEDDRVERMVIRQLFENYGLSTLAWNLFFQKWKKNKSN